MFSLYARVCTHTQVLSRCTLGNQSYADLYFSANIAHMQRIRERCNPDAKIYLSIWYVWMDALQETHMQLRIAVERLPTCFLCDFVGAGRWHYMCAQKVLDSDQLDYYAQDANVLEPFQQASPQ